MAKRPNVELAKRPLHFIWIADCSGSMQGEKMASLNHAIREALPHMKDAAKDNPHAEVLVRVVAFSSGAWWHVAHPTNVEHFSWVDLKSQGVTDMGQALRLVAEQLAIPPMTDRALPPVLVLVSDGQPTDDFSGACAELMAQRWAQKAVRIAIAIGHDADTTVLSTFIGNSERAPLQANNADDLVRQIKWASTEVLKAASAPKSQTASAPQITPIPQAPTAGDASLDVW